MAYSTNIVYLSKAQYQELLTNQTITVNGTTVTYNDNDIYVTPQAEPITDVRINGTSIGNNGVADIPIASETVFGACKVGSYYGLSMSNGFIQIVKANDSYIKAGANNNRPIVASSQHTATFYGLAKAAGHDEASSTEPFGTYTPEAKGAIQSMLGVSDLIAPSENNLVASKAYSIGEVFTANGKLYKATAAIAADAAIIPEVDGEEVAGANCVETNMGDYAIHDVQINSSSIINNGIANIPVATTSALGVVSLLTNGGITKNSDNAIYVQSASDTEIKSAGNAASYKPIVPYKQHQAVFYGLAKAAGDTTQSASSNAVGTYTDAAKASIRNMLDAASTNVIAVQDTQPTDSDTKLWLPETEDTPVLVPTMDDMNTALAGKVGDVQVNGSSVVNNNVANIPIASNSQFGVVTIGNGLTMINDMFLAINAATSAQLKTGTQTYRPIVPSIQHESTFYGLAKAAGDTTQSQSENAIGTYTDDAKAAIQTMLGVPGDVQVNGTSVVSNGVANIPYATSSTAGVVYTADDYGTAMLNGLLYIKDADETRIKAGVSQYRPITPTAQHMSVFYGLAKAAGDTTQSASSNAVGTYTDEAKAAIQQMLGIDLASIASQVDIPLVETIDSATPSITGQPNTRYVCGEVTSISITPPAAGSVDVVFTSGSTVAVLTTPNTVKWPNWFDASSLDANTIYEILITDGVYGSVMTWAI